MERKQPKACKEWGWQYAFPSARSSVDLRSGHVRHMSDTFLTIKTRSGNIILVKKKGQKQETGKHAD
jgi:hypothetical protein